MFSNASKDRDRTKLNLREVYLVKKQLIALFLAVSVIAGITAYSGSGEPVELAVSSDLIDMIMTTYSARSFKEGAVSDEIIEVILQCGQKAPSAANGQPWHFTVIKNADIAGQLVSRHYQKGAVVIVVSGKNNERGFSIAFDCALAAENMFLAAQSLGLGARMYLTGVQNVNDSLRGSLGIPDGYEAQIIMLVGYVDDDVDAVSSATPRNPVSVNYVE